MGSGDGICGRSDNALAALGRTHYRVRKGGRIDRTLNSICLCHLARSLLTLLSDRRRCILPSFSSQWAAQAIISQLPPALSHLLSAAIYLAAVF